MILAAQRIITGDGVTVLENQALVVQNQRIQAIGKLEELKKDFPGQEVRDYGAATIIPGMMDMHSHVGLYDGCPDANEYDGYRMGILAKMQLEECFRWGVTTIRDAGCPDGLLESMRRAANKGHLTVPRIFHCNQAIAMTGGHCWSLNIVTEADGIEGCIKAVRQQIKAGADWIKIMTGHRTETPEYTQEELNVMVEEAHRFGRKVEVHAALNTALPMAIACGCDSIEHGSLLTPELARQMREKNIYWCPTMSFLDYWTPLVTVNHRMYNEYAQGSQDTYPYFKGVDGYVHDHFVEVVNASQVKIITGTDCDNGYGRNGSASLEVADLIKCGWDPLLAIQAGTYNCAEILDIHHEVGLVKEGYLADLAVLNGNPLADGSVLTDIVETFSNGQSVYKKGQAMPAFRD